MLFLKNLNVERCEIYIFFIYSFGKAGVGLRVKNANLINTSEILNINKYHYKLEDLLKI